MQELKNWRLRLRPIAAVTAALAVTALAACNRPADDNRTAGERVDSAVTKTERQAGSMKEDAKSAAANAGQTTERAANEVSDKVKDAAITTAVNAKLAQDKGLSALKIDVDTVNGRVSLRGTAPDPAARERATTLASAVDGVVSVDNQLVVSAKG
ncbi:MAG TPA: BON domain-containing protein [Burkholderiaceae bacterium]|nr:BON domain-containing protein [Burkholderiaceae bacterium]